MFIGIDIGGTNTRVGLFPSLDHPTFTLLTRFPTQQHYEEQMRLLVSTLREHSTTALDGIGVSFGGRMAPDGRSVLVAPNMPEYVGRPFALDLEQAFSCPVRLAHDTVCGLLGEKKFGHLRAHDRCAYLTLSTGTGAAFQLRTSRNVLTVSIEIGHQLLDGNDLLCLCGQTGCLETYTGGRQLELRLGCPVAHISNPAFWETFCSKLSLGLVNLVALTRVEFIAVSGAIALHNAFLLPLLQQKVCARLHGALLELCHAALAEDAPLVGAAVLLSVPDETIVH